MLSLLLKQTYAAVDDVDGRDAHRPARKAQQRSGILQDQKCMRLSPGQPAAVARMAMLMALR